MDYKKFIRPFTIGAALATLVFLIYQFDLGGLLSDLELKTYDLRFQFRGAISPQLPIVIVTIDQDSFDELNLPWPWPRDLHALLIQKLVKNQVKLIALDVLFVEPKRGILDHCGTGRNHGVPAEHEGCVTDIHRGKGHEFPAGSPGIRPASDFFWCRGHTRSGVENKLDKKA
ncbi:MAG: CHASE2 domain-containing protein [Acidobacteria bacterium]|nr:CHASE2 domain-containing protein [Acidobacteriota bacterium]